ncbi:MAG: hypothetical protein IT371_08700 [Deltaproteobacteria bacterium]|nr:hypothetical protein [Deltaproteobacteria bacterium]
MLGQAFLASVVVPAVVAVLALLLAWQPFRRDERPRGGWGLPAGLGLAYLGASYLAGGGLLGSSPNHRLALVVAAGSAVGVLEALAPTLPRLVTWALRVGGSAGAAWFLLVPLAAPQNWSRTHFGLWVGAVAAAMLFVWLVVAHRASREPGGSLGAGLLLLGGVGSASVLLSGLTSTAQLLGAIATVLGVGMVGAWRFTAPETPRLRGIAPGFALGFVGHLAVALGYGELPAGSFALLAVAPAALLVGGLAAPRRLPVVVALALRLVLVAAPAGSAAGLAALHYFGASVTTPDAGEPKGKARPDPRNPDYDPDYGYE